MCMEHVPAEDVHALIVCGHRFHVQCLRTFLEIEIREARIYPSCFQPDVDGGGDQPQRGPCGRAIPEHELAQLVSADTWTKYEQFKFCRDNPNARECPFCDHLQVCDIASSKEPECTCQQCHREFCFVHSNAHVGRSCADYDAQTADDQRLSRSTINQIAKPCPGCNNPVEKNGGCNHMTCVICRTSFCWLCCAIVDDSPAPEHFAWWNIAGCPNSLLADDHTAATDDDATPITTTNAVAACLLRLGAVLLVLVLGPIGAPLGLLCTACCWPSHRFRSRFRGNFRLALSWCIRMCMRLVWVLPLTIFVLIVTLPVVPFIGLAALSGEIESCFIDIRFELDWAIGRHGLRTCPQCTENITRPGGFTTFALALDWHLTNYCGLFPRWLSSCILSAL
ncbi:TPA: hypothetical protein N0F65_002680 [Lagenidium giganteum]|uniref:RBR-type E3 ubiquitin transferase n=1 Tax=Lagenidium giganteum TaxID=4803 RepID=A0AAV2Z8W5_9STRA|nr:TPA: hypothetical protein N0F65_002680 [Lagenidium giganteum]